MCKLFGIVEIENQKNAEHFAKTAIPHITKTDNHGLGIMRLGENGVHIQRWLEPPQVIRKKKSKALAKYERALKHQQNEEGKASKALYAIAIHGRFATCERTMENTHPFYRDGAALMHNGIIPNAEKFERVLSTCDSEALLSQYLKHDVRGDNSKLTAALTGIGGYYAAIVFNDGGTIDVWRDETAKLYLAHVRNVGVVFATTEEIILKTAKACKAYVTGIDEILPYTTIRWDKGVSPAIGTFESIKPLTVISNGISNFTTVGSKFDVSDYEKWWKEKDDDEGYYKGEGYSLDWNTPRGNDYTPTREEIADAARLRKLQTRGEL